MVRGYPMMSAVISVVLLLGLVVLPGTPAHGADRIVTIATYSDLRYKELKEQIGPSIEKKYPGIKIKVETAPGGQYWTKLYTMAASKEAPDIFDTARHVAPPPGVDGSFHLRRSAMTIGGSYTINYTYRAITSFDWDVAMVPKGPSGRVLYGGTNTWAVMKRPGQDIETVWKVVKELIGEQALGSFLGGWVPVMRSVALSDKWMERNLPPKNKIVLLKSAPYMRDADFSPNWSQWQAAKNRELAPAMAGTRSVEASLIAAETAINQVIQTFAGKK